MMKTINNFRFLIIMVMLCIIPGSCEEFVEVDLPGSQLTGESVFDDPSTANAAMVDIYAKMRDQGILAGTSFGLSIQLGAYADELDYYGAQSGPTYPFHTNALLPSNSAVAAYWTTSYNHIYAANAVYEGVQASHVLTAEERNKLQGESLFVRALLHFYLANLFGDVPYIITTDHVDNSTVSRLPVAVVYENIIADLELAIMLLPEDADAQRVRPSKSAAYALLSRTYLYSGAWAESADAASAVINSSSFTWVGDLNNVFLKESTGTIWQFMPQASGKNADEGLTFSFVTGPPPRAAISNALLASFTPGDLRKAQWLKEVTNGTQSWYHAYKYKQRTPTAVSLEYSIVFRLAEQYLIRAEARARQGDISGAQSDLNKIRNRAGLTDTEADTTDELVDAILEERRLEFFTEYGHRFFDLKRTGRLDVALAAKPGWNATDRLFPIPETELSVNPNLHPQNDGY